MTLKYFLIAIHPSIDLLVEENLYIAWEVNTAIETCQSE